MALVQYLEGTKIDILQTTLNDNYGRQIMVDLYEHQKSPIR
jgi:hypothetical protein